MKNGTCAGRNGRHGEHALAEMTGTENMRRQATAGSKEMRGQAWGDC